MSLAELRLQNVRCLAAAELALHPGLNLISGPNGAGKTTLLEAIYLLGRGRSFRTRHTEQLIREQAEGLWVAGRVAGSGTEGIAQQADLVGSGASPGSDDAPGAGRAILAERTRATASGDAALSRTASGTELPSRRVDLRCDPRDGVIARVDARPVGSLAELSEALPVQVIDPGIHRLIEEGPVRRRRWLDWAVFHVEPGFVGQWQGYMRALRQRNAALRGEGGDPAPWESEMARLGEALTLARSRTLEGLQPHWAQALAALEAAPATLTFHAGWSREVPLSEQLVRQRERDRQRGHTGAGPHRCDVVLRIEGRAVREVISRGQQKVLGAAMTLALARYVALIAGRTPLLLLDDPAAELDAPHTQRLLEAVGHLQGQSIVTALHPEGLSGTAPDRAFHVEHGGVKTV